MARAAAVVAVAVAMATSLSHIFPAAITPLSVDAHFRAHGHPHPHTHIPVLYSSIKSSVITVTPPNLSLSRQPGSPAALTPLSLWHNVMVSPWRDRDVFSYVQGVHTYSSGAAAIGGYHLTEADWNLFKL